MPKLPDRLLRMKESARKAGTVRGGMNVNDGGFRVMWSETNMASVPGLQRCADLFGNACHPDKKGDFPNEEKNPGDSIIEFEDALSQYLNSKGDDDYRPTRILYKLEVERAKKGEKGEVVEKYPFLPRTTTGEATKKQRIAMVEEIKRRGYEEMKGMFGSGMEEEVMITKISLIAYGSREQMLHTDMAVDRKKDLSRGTIAPGSMIFNVQGGSCRLGVVYVGDPEDEGEIGKGKGFRHFGGVCCRVENIGKGCFAWLDAETVHYGAIHSADEGPCVRLHVEFKKRSRVATILAATENNFVRVVYMSELLELHKNSSVEKNADLQKKALGWARRFLAGWNGKKRHKHGN